MGAFLNKPQTEKFTEHGEGNGLRYAVASMQGWRSDMEDAHVARINLGDTFRDWSYFAVFDGHAGGKVSAHCSQHLLKTVMASEEFQEDVIKGIRNGFLNLDNNMRLLPEVISGEDKSGSTALCAFVLPRLIYIANCGDSRAILCKSCSSPIFATQDHKPALPAEMKRIVNAGGSVTVQRVNGSLAVSRALGDYEYKNLEGRGQCEQLVSPEPEIFVMDRDETYEFLVLACDGIWDVMSNGELCDFIRSRLKVTSDLREVTSQVIDTCLYKGSHDNMSIILVVFPAAPTISEKAVQMETDLNFRIERAVREIIEQNKDIRFHDMYRQFRNGLACFEDDLPPGGGIESKRSLIEEVYKQLCSPELAKTVTLDDHIPLSYC